MSLHSAVSRELQVSRYKRGVKLVPPNNDTKITLGGLLDQSFNVFVQELDQSITEINEACWASCGFQSRNDAIGSWADKVCSDKASLEKLKKNNAQVISKHTNIITNEKVIYDDGSELQTLSLKFPIYDNYDNVQGLMGCALNVADLNKLANDLNYLNQFLLDQYSNSNSLNQCNPALDYGLTRREIEIIKSIIRGKTLRATAAILNLSARTVESYFESIKNKIGVASKSEVIERLYDQYR